MAITADNITSHEFIGLHTQIVESTNPQVIGLNGRVINETKSMLTIHTDSGSKHVAKETCTWKFTLENLKTVTIDGFRIAKRPYDRIGGKAPKATKRLIIPTGEKQ